MSNVFISEWRDAKEDLPIKHGHYLVTLHSYGELEFRLDETVVRIMRWHNEWVLPRRIPKEVGEAITDEVLAWMPLPDPYREVE